MFGTRDQIVVQIIPYGREIRGCRARLSNADLTAKLGNRPAYLGTDRVEGDRRVGVICRLRIEQTAALARQTGSYRAQLTVGGGALRIRDYWKEK